MRKRYSPMWQFRAAVTPGVAVMIGVSALLLGTGRTQAQVVIDQQNTVGGSSSGSTAAGQSFTPSLTGISFATFSVATPNVPDTLRLDLFDGSGYGGTLLASSAPVTLNTGAVLQPIEFDFSSTVSLTPGNFYTARVVLVSGGASYSAAFSSSNPYAGGMAFGSNGIPAPTNDLVFSEGLNVVPEPSALALSALCGIGLAGSRKIRNLFWPPKKLLAPGLPLMTIGVLLACALPGRAQFISQVLGDNPKGFWILNDAPGTPTSAVDSSVNGFNGTYGPGVSPQGMAGPSWVPASGLVANFNGSGNITFGNSLNLGANRYTLEAWINPTLASLQNPSRIVASGHGLEGYGFGTTAGGQLLFSTFAQQDYETTLAIPLLPNQWYYVGLVLDASNDANFYVNGVLRQTVPGTLPTNPPALDFTIGSRSPSPINPADEFFTGGLAGISVYDTALTASQIQAQYNAAAVPEPSSLVLTGLAALSVGRAVWRRRRKGGNSVLR